MVNRSPSRRQRVAPGDVARLARVLGALGDQTRLRIAIALIDRERSVSELVTDLGVAQSTVSNSLRRLLDLDIVSRRREAQTVFYQLRVPFIQATLRQGLIHVQSIRQ
jgi:DNA-binding transcriptional ArsR family regulator